ncbi:MAG: hypothetical protein MJA31_00930 [Clostridia bacterium]|nr:hypothetical protein [Clostridia bacterium]
MKGRRIILLCVCIILMLTVVLAACDKKEAAQDNTPQPNKETQSKDTEAEETPEPESMYPETLKIFCAMSEHISKGGATDYNDSYVFQELEKITGTRVEWNHPAAGADYDMALNLLITSNDLPDILTKWDWKDVSGGIASWVEDEVIIDLTDLVDENMPNYMSIINDLPNAKRDLMVDGKLYFINELSHMSPWRGPIIRGDWLEKLNMDIPETVDELYDVLVAIRDGDLNETGKQDVWAMSGQEFTNTMFGVGNLLWPFGSHYDFMLKDGKIVYGPMLPGFTEGMEFIHKLYSEELLDPDYSSQDRNALDGKFMNNLVGYEFGIQPSKMNNAMAETEFKAVGVPQLKKTQDSPAYGFGSEYNSYYNLIGAAVTTAAEDPAKALAWMDYFFTEEGTILANYGIEDISFKIEDGKKVQDFTKALELNSHLDESTIKYFYTQTTHSTIPIRQSLDAYLTGANPYSAAAMKLWKETTDTSHILPPYSLTDDESKLVNDKMVDIDTYMEVAFDKLVNGQTPISEIPDIQQKLVDLGINEILEVHQAAYDRYLGK